MICAWCKEKRREAAHAKNGWQSYCSKTCAIKAGLKTPGKAHFEREKKRSAFKKEKKAPRSMNGNHNEPGYSGAIY